MERNLFCLCYLTDRENPKEKREQEQRNQRDKDHPPTEIAYQHTSHGRSYCRSHGCDQRGDSHHQPQFFGRNLLQNDIKHQRQGDTCSHTLDQTAQEQKRKYRGNSSHNGSYKEQADGGDKKFFQCKPLF